VRVMDGEFRKGMKVNLLGTNTEFEVLDTGKEIIYKVKNKHVTQIANLLLNFK
jgi:translation elongation factor EF-4